MPTKKTEPAPDFSSDEPVVYFVGAAAGADVPGRHLNMADLARVHRIKALQASGGEPVAPATADELHVIAEQLVATGGFSRTAPAEEPPTPTEAPAAPAEEIN